MDGRAGRLAVALFLTLSLLGTTRQAAAQGQPAPQSGINPDSMVPKPAAPGAERTAAPSATESSVDERSNAPSESSQITPPATPAPATSGASLEPEVRAWLDSRDVACEFKGVLAKVTYVFVACGSHGYIVLSTSANGFVFHEARQLDGEVIGFFQHSEKVWARVLEERAVVVRPGSTPASERPPPKPTLAPAPTKSTLPPASATSVADVEEEDWPTGDVLQVDGLRVKVSMGANDGVEARMRVAFAASNSVVGMVDDVQADHSWVEVGMNETVKVGEAAFVTASSVTASRTAPARVTHVWELRAMLRPLLNLGAFGGGVLGELSAGYRTQHFHYGAQVAPFGLAATEDDGVATVAAFVFGAFDSKVFSAGLGLGGQTVNAPEFLTNKGTGISLVQLLRIGAVDGLHLASRTRAVVFRSETTFSSLELQGQLAVASDAWLILRGGGGDEGYGYGEVAVRNLLQGNGGAGSVFLEVSVGGAAVFESFCDADAIERDETEFCFDENVGGPLVGLGAEWRL